MEFLEDGRLELYNLATDIGEKDNLAEKQSARTRDLYAKLVAWRKEISAPMPTPNDGVAQPKKQPKKKKSKE